MESPRPFAEAEPRTIARALLAAFALAPGAFGSGGSQDDPTVPAGAGSYTTDRPPGLGPLPDAIYRTAELTGPTPTNQWWSSLVWQPFSRALFAHPLALHAAPTGLAIGYPGSALASSPAAIMGRAIENGGDLVLGLAGAEAFEDARLAAHSDWFVTARFAADSGHLDASFGHGGPFVFCEVEGGAPLVRIRGDARIWSGSPDAPGRGDTVLGLTVHGSHYGLFGPAGSRWVQEGERTLRCESRSRRYFSVALLPDDTPGTLARFAAVAHNHVVGTRLEYTVSEGHVEARYLFELERREGRAKGTLFALYPHQWKYTDHELEDVEYASVRGALKLGAGDAFTTRVPVQGVLPHLPAEGLGPREAFMRDLRREVEGTRAARDEWGDTYWEGKRLGRLASLAGIAEAAGEEELRLFFLMELRRRLENWFTASEGETAPLFYYDARWGTLVGSRASYGSDSQLNDHHFHYGYFIRAAAEVGRHDPEWARAWAPMVELLIRDIAAQDPRDPMYPRLRCFDLYAGHSWASGHADFADGNNQESSSESLNAWYGLILWGELTGDTGLRDLGVFLFNTERTAVEEYWFDVDGTNFPEDFPNEQLGMVWGGKGAFGTWFSGAIDCIHGINWLPFTPASLYLGRHPAHARRSHERTLAVREEGQDYGRGWGDLLLMHRALYDAEGAVELLAATEDGRLDPGNSRAFMRHWCHTVERVGGPASVTADHPLAAVFEKEDARTYAAYNGSDGRLVVRFSDGVRIEVEPRSYASVERLLRRR